MSPSQLGSVVITGAAGFIGSRLSTHLVARGHHVIGIDCFDDFWPAELKLANLGELATAENFELHRLDIRGAEIADVIPSNVSAVIHLAALAGVRPSMQRATAYTDVNVGGTAAVLNLVQQRGIPHVVFASSSSVYGVNPAVPWLETTPPEPISVYAMTKLAGEALARHQSRHHGFSLNVARFFTVYGPGQRPDLAITGFASRMLRGEPLQVYGDGSALRDFTYVDDIVDGIERMLHWRTHEPQTFNLASGRRVALSEVIDALSETLDISPRIDYLERVEGDVHQTWGSIERSREVLGFQPTVDLHEGIARSRSWFEIVARHHSSQDQRIPAA